MWVLEFSYVMNLGKKDINYAEQLEDFFRDNSDVLNENEQDEDLVHDYEEYKRIANEYRKDESSILCNGNDDTYQQRLNEKKVELEKAEKKVVSDVSKYDKYTLLATVTKEDAQDVMYIFEKESVFVVWHNKDRFVFDKYSEMIKSVGKVIELLDWAC